MLLHIDIFLDSSIMITLQNDLGGCRYVWCIYFDSTFYNRFKVD